MARVVSSGETKTTVALKDGLQVDLRVVPRASFGAALAYFTGSKAHNIHLRRIAQERGLLLNEYALFRGESIVAGKTEEQVYRALKLPWIAPEMREDRGEIEAASSGTLPNLIDRTDLRGDLHTHSTYTDGRSSIEDMARKVRESGLNYFAVTDHSRRIAMAHGLDPALCETASRLDLGEALRVACEDGCALGKFATRPARPHRHLVHGREACRREARGTE